MEEETEMGNDELCMTSRSRTPSLFDVKSNHDTVFAQLPDLIQEAIVSTECKSFSCNKPIHPDCKQFQTRDYELVESPMANRKMWTL